MFKKIIFIFLVFLSFTSNTDAAQKYKYICDDNQCYNTINDYVSDNIYYMTNVTEISTDNFSDFLNSKFLYYINYYDGINFEVQGYCDGTCDSIENKYFTLKDLYEYNSGFSIGKSSFFGGITIQKTYDNGKDYIFDNFTIIINTLHSGFPIGSKKNKLSDLFSNILSYNQTTNNILLRNICETNTCKKSKKAYINYNSNSTFVFLDGDVKYYDTFKKDTFKVSSNYSLSPYMLKAGSGVVFNFGFEDYLDQLVNQTEYEYRIYYNYEGEGIPDYDKYLFKETIRITNDYKVSSETIEDDIIGNYIDLNVLNSDDKKIRVGVKEGISLTKSGKVNFYLAVKNITSGDSFDIKLINTVPLTVLPSDKINDSESSITYPTFNPNINSDAQGYSSAQPFEVKVKLYDVYKNIQKDTISGYDISLSAGSSSEIILSNSKDGEYFGNLTGVKSNNDLLIFYFKIPSAGYHKITGFNIKSKIKQDSYTYKNPIEYTTINNVIPSNLYDGSNLMNIYIKPNIVSELVGIKCGKTVTINFVCKSDNLSGCNILKNTKKIYTSESENGSSGYLTISDNAYNVRQYDYVMNHVDRTAPYITIRKGDFTELNSGTTYSYKANSDKLNIFFEEKTTESCSPVVKYTVKVNDVVKYNGTLNGKETSFYINDFFHKSDLNKKLEVISEDAYGNKSNKILYFNVYPDSVDESKSIVTLKDTKDTKYGNNYDIYNYELALKDKFSNPVYNKDILSFDTNCTGINGCINLKTLLGTSGVDSILETFDNKTDTNGVIKFTLKSLVPGLFREIFKIQIREWNQNYVDTTTIKQYSIGKFTNTNKFLIPIKAELSIIEGGIKPEIGMNQKYKIGLSDLSTNLNGFTNGILNISKFSIINKVEGHFWNMFNVINKSFNNNLNTNLGFSGSVDANDNILSGVDLLSDNFDVSYNIGGEDVKYILDDFGIKGCNVATLGLKVIGNLQGDGKSSITGQSANFSDISKSELRSQIRLNGFKLVKSMDDGDIIGKVKYVEGDISISGNNLGYETLVVYNGNVIINGDLNQNADKLGIIVLKDNYITNTDYNKSGNVYVNNNVENINAIIYADGGFFSARSNGSRYSDLELNKVLTLNGSLFTRNTIGGAVRGNTSYTLPGGKTTTNFNLAEIYDLNYIRKVDNQCDATNNYSFLIKYDSKIQSNPPIGFSN
ncbi:MAG: hypothetical protein PHS49_01620 [Candidatus Gracilibacteria bacterium]|nr:hypothetical protein [Candidatus Gracilibacteria bacterium]